jgi:signal transduction histidine kinase
MTAETVPKPFELAADLIGSAQRAEAAQRLAGWLGCERVLIFLRDSEVQAWLPAPGFAQTLPDAEDWQGLLDGCRSGSIQTRQLIDGPGSSPVVVLACATNQGSVLAALGGSPSPDRVTQFCELLPIVGAALRREQKDRYAVAQAQVEHQLAAEHQTMAQALDRTRRQLERSLLETRQALRMRDEFVSAAAHELRNPLNGLQLTTELMIRMAAIRDKVSSAEIALQVRKLKGQIQRLLKVVNTLLDVSRISAGRLQLEIEEFSLHELLIEVIERFKDWPNAVPIKLNSAPVNIRADRLRTDLVINNLVENAIKYGNGKPIEVDVLIQGPAVLIRVADKGIGIAPEDMNRIFERFERACPNGPQPGLGLGLWIVRRIVQACGWHIRVQSNAGGGSIFTIEMPLTGAQSEREPGPA